MRLPVIQCLLLGKDWFLKHLFYKGMHSRSFYGWLKTLDAIPCYWTASQGIPDVLSVLLYPQKGCSYYFDSTFKRVFILLYTEFFLHDPLSVRGNSNFLTIFSLYTIIKTVCVGLFPRISRVGKRHKRSTCFYTDMLMAIYDEHFDPAYALEA